MKTPAVSLVRIAATSALLLFLNACTIRRPPAPVTHWNDPAQWTTNLNPASWGQLTSEGEDASRILKLEYKLGGDHGWVELSRELDTPLPEHIPVVMQVKSEGTGQLEIKLVDGDGSVFGTRQALTEEMGNWTPFVIYPYNTEYWWGGENDEFSGLTRLQIAVSTKGRGTLWLNVQGPGRPGAPTTLPVGGAVLDPDRELPGIGLRQRRAAEMIPEDPLVLEWLKVVQDTFSPERRLLPSMECNEAQTFNNALVAMAFLVKGERERAERILDFYARATDRNNEDPRRQNFFYKGEARGFFQAVALRNEGGDRAYHTRNANDRWMGDMAWLMCAYKYHEQLYGPERYAEIRGLLLDLMLSWYVEAKDGPGGYIGHGWRAGDARLHEGFGHHEGNIDAYAVMLLYNKPEVAANIRTWLDRTIRGRSLPLDLYTWRTLAYGPEALHLLDIPDFDLRYRKVLHVNGEPVMGLYDHANLHITNSWLDGVGHIACAYISAGNPERGYFYANQLDPFIIERIINGQVTHAIPYVANNTGGYEWVDLNRGFVSVAAWYVFAKNKLNPLTLQQH
jgi:hypothetical protein